MLWLTSKYKGGWNSIDEDGNKKPAYGQSGKKNLGMLQSLAENEEREQVFQGP
jgi:hypothetical protein